MRPAGQLACLRRIAPVYREIDGCLACGWSRGRQFARPPGAYLAALPRCPRCRTEGRMVQSRTRHPWPTFGRPGMTIKRAMADRKKKGQRRAETEGREAQAVDRLGRPLRHVLP